MLNRAILTGRLTRDPELRYTTSGTAVVQATIAVDRQFKNQQGEREADFINLVIWRKVAENFANFTHKGSLVGIDGRIQTRTYENKQGQRVYVTEINVDSFSLLEHVKKIVNNLIITIPHRYQIIMHTTQHQIVLSKTRMLSQITVIRIMTLAMVDKVLIWLMTNCHSKWRVEKLTIAITCG